MGQLSTPLAEIPALFAEISARRVTRLSHINNEPAKQYFNIAAGISPLPSNSASRVTRLHINKPLDGHHAISFPFLLAKNSNVLTLGPEVQTFNQIPGRADDNGPIYLYFAISQHLLLNIFTILKF